MKKLASILVLVFAFTLTTQAQKRDNKERKAKLTTEQKAALTVKKMTLALDLTENQQKQLRPLVTKQINERTGNREKMMAMRESGKKPTSEEKYAFINARLDEKIAVKNEMKKFLNDNQFIKFEKMADNRDGKKGIKNRMKKGKRHSEK